MAFPRDTSSIRHHGSDHIHTIPPAVVRYSSVAFFRLALPLAISSCGSNVRRVEESASAEADSDSIRSFITSVPRNSNHVKFNTKSRKGGVAGDQRLQVQVALIVAINIALMFPL